MNRDWTGWTLEVTEHHGVHIELPARLGELEHARMNALRDAVGEKALNACNAADDEIDVDRLTADEATSMAERLRDAGFAVTMSARESYFASHRTSESIRYIDDVSADEKARIAREMIAWGVPVVRKAIEQT